jgi:hypothetical protein
MEIWKDAAEALKPAADRVLIMALPTERVDAGHAVMDMRRERFHRFIPAMIVDVVEGLPDFHFYNRPVYHLSSPTLKRSDAVACGAFVLISVALVAWESKLCPSPGGRRASGDPRQSVPSRPSPTASLHRAGIGRAGLEVRDTSPRRLTPLKQTDFLSPRHHGAVHDVSRSHSIAKQK